MDPNLLNASRTPQIVLLSHFAPRKRGRAHSSCARVKEFQNARFIDLIADCHHVVAIGDRQRPALREQGGQFLRRAGDIVLGADRDQHGHRNAGDLLVRKGLVKKRRRIA